MSPLPPLKTPLQGRITVRPQANKGRAGEGPFSRSLRNPIFLQSPQKSIAAGLAYLPRAPGVHVAVRLFCDSPVSAGRSAASQARSAQRPLSEASPLRLSWKHAPVDASEDEKARNAAPRSRLAGLALRPEPGRKPRRRQRGSAHEAMSLGKQSSTCRASTS